MDVTEIMTRDPIVASPKDNVADALRLLDDQQIRHLPIVDDGRLVGMVSDRDLREYRLPLMDELEDPDYAAGLGKAAVSEAMATQIVTIEPSESVAVAIDLIIEHGIGAIPVVEQHTEQLVGIVSYVDVLRSLRTSA